MRSGGESGLKAVNGGGSANRAAEFSRLYTEAYPLVYNYVSFRMAGSPDVEDVVAEAFLKAARAFDRYDPSRSKFSTWVTSIARNCIIDYWARQKPQATLDDIPEGYYAAEDDYSGMDDTEAEARRLLAALDEKDRELVYLKYYEGKRNKEIAQELGMNESTVATRLQRALAKMRKAASSA